MSDSDSPTPDTVLVTVESAEGVPSLRAAAKDLRVHVEDLDANFGIVAIDPDRGLYCVQVRADRLPAGFEHRIPYQGPYANPNIATFGPIDERKKRNEG